MKIKCLSILSFILALSLALSSCSFINSPSSGPDNAIDLETIPPYNGVAYVVINNNEPFFTDEEKSITESFERYSELDSLGRCGPAVACVGTDIMPTEDREDLYVEPSGWVQRKYDGVWLYNRCHLIGFQLTGENNNEKNLVTGTDFMNKNHDGMLGFENMVADYIKDTENHVMYRVTPIYEGIYDLVAKGIQIEAYSVEDEGDGICFNVYCYNVQPGIVINYYDGTSRRATDPDVPSDTPDDENKEGCYILNKSSKKIHKDTCKSASSISEQNKAEFTGVLEIVTKEDGSVVAIVNGVEYSGCGSCKPLD